ncbi:MAG: flagellin [Spirochaetota bacterium]|jgi:flagellin|nr:flagellin [Spirochaetota bacterium]
MIINHNISSIFANRNLKINNQQVDRDIEKLSSGMRINRAGDDASGLAVSEKMRSQVRGLYRAARNAEDGISMIQTAEGYLQQTQDVMQRLRELAVQAANGIYTSQDRMMMQVEVSQLVDEVDRIASHAQFNEMNLLTGRFGNDTQGQYAGASMWFHIGANMDQRKRVYIGTMSTRALGIRSLSTASFITLSTPNDANKAIGVLDQALMRVSKQRADLGAYQSRLEFAVKGIMIGYENIQAAESRIRDTDMAEQMSTFVKDQILTTSATAMLGQANLKPQSVLRLLQ